MAEPASGAPEPLEAAVEQAIAICDGDARAALPNPSARFLCGFGWPKVRSRPSACQGSNNGRSTDLLRS